MAKQKEEKTNVMRLLEQKKIPYTPHAYPHDGDAAPDGASVAAMLGQDPPQHPSLLLLFPSAAGRRYGGMWHAKAPAGRAPGNPALGSGHAHCPQSPAVLYSVVALGSITTEPSESLSSVIVNACCHPCFPFYNSSLGRVGFCCC